MGVWHIVIWTFGACLSVSLFWVTLLFTLWAIGRCTTEALKVSNMTRYAARLRREQRLEELENETNRYEMALQRAARQAEPR